MQSGTHTNRGIVHIAKADVTDTFTIVIYI